MKTLFPILMLFALTSCDPFNFGFKKNPAYVLDEAVKAVSNIDHLGLIEVSGKEALCLYGNPKGILYLKENLNFDVSDLKIKHELIDTKHSSSPDFVGFWSYFKERYIVDVSDKKSKEMILKALIECNYGTIGEKKPQLAQVETNKYPIRECRVIKIIPIKFSPLKMTPNCEMMKVAL